MTVGAYIRERRHALGLTVRDAAAQAGISGTHQSYIELGKSTPSQKVLRAIAEVLQVSPGALIILAGEIPEDLRPKTFEAAQAIAQAVAVERRR